MKIQPFRIKIKDLVQGYQRDEESGEVVAFACDEVLCQFLLRGQKLRLCEGEKPEKSQKRDDKDTSALPQYDKVNSQGDKTADSKNRESHTESKPRLNIRPKYQRNFVYKDEQQKAVIGTILKGFPLNIMYWVKNAESSAEYEFEVLDGQQRTISICEYFSGSFSFREQNFHNLPSDKQEDFLNYELHIYICEGKDSEKLEWFKVINIAGEKLTEQELRNAIYASRWLTDAKVKFSKHNCLCEQKAGKYLKGNSNRQEFLERALMWKVNSKEDKAICEYMARNAKDCKNADELWSYFSAVIEWVQMKFSKYRKEMKGLEWGFFYNQYKDKALDSKELESQIATLMQDSEVTNKKGIYEYLLSGNEKFLSLRVFDEDMKRQMYEKQGGKCANPKCLQKDKIFEMDEMEADHIKPWSKGGKTTLENGQMLCRACNRAKGGK